MAEIKGTQAKFFISDGLDPDTFVEVAEVTEFDLPGMSDEFRAEGEMTLHGGPIAKYRLARWSGMSRLASLWEAIRWRW